MSGRRCLTCMQPLTVDSGKCPRCGALVPCPPNPPECLQPGNLLGNRFLIGRVIGRGGYSIFYIVYDQRLQTARCIKEFFPKNCRRMPDGTPDAAPGQEGNIRRLSERFRQEARIISAMSEDNVRNVVNVFDQLSLNGNPFILMEFLSGCTMDEWITSRRKGLPWQEACRDISAVLQSLQGIHDHGYLHRNISLSNIFRTSDGGIRVIGFGSAEPIETAKKNPGMMWPSSKRYYSPSEQISNSVQGPWTDVYAAGACLFKAVAGGWPQNHRNGEVFPALRPMGFEIPESLDKVINRATQPDPKKRYPTAAAMLEMLDRAGRIEARDQDRKKRGLPFHR